MSTYDDEIEKEKAELSHLIELDSKRLAAAKAFFELKVFEGDAAAAKRGYIR